MRVDYNPYEGRVVKGAPPMVLSRGEVIVDDGTFVGRRGRGEFVQASGRARRWSRESPGFRLSRTCGCTTRALRVT